MSHQHTQFVGIEPVRRPVVVRGTEASDLAETVVR